MRMLYGVGRPAFPFFIGGDGTIAHTILSGLERRQWDCRFVGTFGRSVVNNLERLTDLAVEYSHANESLTYRIPYCVSLSPENFYISLVEKSLIDFKPHVVISQLEGAKEVLTLAKQQNCTTALYVLDVDHEENFRAFDAEPDVVFAVSHFVADLLNKRFGRTAHVLHPLIDLDSYRTHRVRDFITMINPVGVKGAEIGFHLASHMPELQFLFVEGWAPMPDFVERIQQLPNAVYMSKQIDMRTVYSRTNVLIVPSQWQEAFGRVVVEAQASGIPVIASRTGGLPEALGGGGILVDDHRNPQAWIVALRGLLDDQSAYQRFSKEALENTRRFDLAIELDRIADLLS